MVVNTVSNNNVSVENDTFAELSVVISSLRQEAMSKTAAANRKKKMLFFMRQRWFKERLETIVIASNSAKRISPKGICPQSGSINLCSSRVYKNRILFSTEQNLKRKAFPLRRQGCVKHQLSVLHAHSAKSHGNCHPSAGH